MARAPFQRDENLSSASARFPASLFAGALLAVSSPAYAEQPGATARFPLVAAYGPTVAPPAAPTAVYASASTYTPSASAATVPPPAETAPQPSGPATPVNPYETPAAAPAPAAGSDPAVDRRDHAKEERERAGENWMFAIEGYTTAPVDIGGRVTFETPFRLRLSGAYGIVPGGYFGLVNGAVEASGAYDSFGADNVEATLDDGQVWRAMIGLRPVGGLYFDAGYARIGLAGNLQADQFRYAIDTTLHMWTAEIGFQGQVGDHLLIAIGAGVMKTFSANSVVDPEFALGNTELARLFTQDAVMEYDRRLEEYGIVPTVTLRIGWDFF